MIRLTRVALEHTPITLLLMVLVLVGGVVAVDSIQQELIPNIEFPLATVITVWPGASAEEVAHSVTEPIEDAVRSLRDVAVVSVSSRTSDSFSVVTVRADYGTRKDELRDEVDRALRRVTLPEEAAEPDVLMLDFSAIPVASVSASAEMELEDLQHLVSGRVVPVLEAIDGVGQVSLVGGGTDELLITVDQEKMDAAGVSVATIRSVLGANNLTLPSGTVAADGESIPLLVSHRITSEDALRAMVLVPPDANGGEAAPHGAPRGAPAGPEPVPPADDEQALPVVWGVLGAQRAGDITPEMMELAVAQLPDAVDALTAGQLLALPVATLARVPLQTIERQPPDVLANLAARVGQALAGEIPDQEPGAPTDQEAPDEPQDREPGAPTDLEPPDAPPAGVVTIGDVATVTRVTKGASTINRTDGQPSLGIVVSKEQSANTVTVVNEVLEALDQLDDELDIAFNVVFEQGTFIEESLAAVRNEGLLGAVFAVLVILIFLSFSVRSTVVIALSIPLSLLFALLVMRAQGLSLNLLTLGGLTIAVGRVVDDAIVVLENVFRHIQRGEDKLASVIEGTREVATAITSATLVAVAVFLPLGFIGGLTREFFLPFALTTTYALLASLVVALTVVPVLMRSLLSREVLPEERETWLQRLYTPSLEWALDHRLLTLALAIAFFLVSMLPLRAIPQTFLPDFGEPSMTVDVSMPPGTDIETTDVFAREVEAILFADADVATVETTVGRGGQVFGQAAGDDTARASFFATFVPVQQGLWDRLTADETVDPVAVADRTRAALRDAIGSRPVTVTVSTSAGTGFDSGSFDLQIQSEDEEALGEATELVLAALADPVNWEREENWLDLFRADDDDEPAVVPIINMKSNLADARPVLVVSVDAAAALDRGLTTAGIGLALRDVLEGKDVGEVELTEEDGSPTLPLRVVYPGDTIDSLEALERYPVSGAQGAVPLGEVATVSREPGAVEIRRIDGERAALITGEITDEDSFGVIATAQRIVDDLDLDRRFGESVVTVGAGIESAQQQEGFRDTAAALPVSILIVYLIMVVTFRSLVHPFTILLSLPFAASGAVLGLWVTGRALSVSSLIGLMMLIGIVVANAIVLIDLTQQYRARGMDARTALVRSGRTRLRPILMTAAATVLALLPQALELSGKGGLVASELATTVIGGLVTSTLLTLIVIPVVYSLLDSASRLGSRGGHTPPAPHPAPSPLEASEPLS
jgi:multidrug efflux pump subunit AcrB